MAKPKQTELEGVGRKEIPEVKSAAEAYVAARDARMALTKEEVKTKKALTDLMHQHGVKAYEYEVEIDGEDPIERVAELKVTENLKVRKKGADNGEPEEGADEEKE